MISALQVFRPGVGWIMSLEEKVPLVPGDVLRVSVAVPYKGPAHEFTLYGSIGSRGALWFDEILSARASLPCPDSPEKFTTVIGDLDIEIIGSGLFGVGGISAGNDYDLYVKIEEQPDVITEIDDVINIAGSNGSDITGMLGMMMPLMMLGMVMPMVTEGTEE
ncbi:MAG: hypothetical protein H8D49_04730 [Dehalococcoidia bacterium]|nr:hypothetical protein [Dehalococcoidia bacterium]